MKVGSLCTGYAGLDLAVEEVLGASPAWFSEVDKDASELLAHRFPNVPNLGDLKAVDWKDVPPVDVVTAGYPCQPFQPRRQEEGPR